MQVLVDFVGRIGKINVGGKIDDLYFELNKWSFESKFSAFLYVLSFIFVPNFFNSTKYLQAGMNDGDAPKPLSNSKCYRVQSGGFQAVQ